MPSESEIKARFWKELKEQRTLMLGLEGDPGIGLRPMTALAEEDEGGPLWIFTSTETELVRALGPGSRGAAAFTGRKHDLFASLSGRLALDRDRAVIDRLWNPYVAAWFDGGKDDPRLALLRFEPESAKIWLNATPLGAAIQWLTGADPKESFEDKVAEVAL
jgi:general stress protein 26